MTNLTHDNLVQGLSVLGRDAHLSLTQRQAIRDRLFKKIGQTTLIDAVQTHTEIGDMVMPLRQLQSLFQPRRLVFSMPATVTMIAIVFIATFTTGAMARDARPGDPLFGIRKAFESVQVALTSGSAQKAEVQLAILDDRLQDLQMVDGKNLDVVLQESKKAVANAQTTIAGLKDADAETNVELVNKLKSLIDNQKSTLSAIIKGGGVANDEIRKSVIAMRNELDTLIPTDNEVAPAASTDTTDQENPAPDTMAGQTHFFGTLIMNFGAPAIVLQGKVYNLSGISLDLTPYVGAASLEIFGQVQGKFIFVNKLYLNNQLIWENTPDKDDNNLSRVEGDQNTSLR